tara:strand:- start:1730 stop:2191 length:462 start_codon:yes stop_codon:yes gene_type:complete
MTNRTRTPCVGICSTTYGDEVCRGCKRFSFEVINWNGFTPEERESVWKRLEKLKTQIMLSRLQILEPELLDNKIRYYQLKIKDDLNDLSKAFELIKQVSESFNDLEEFGIKILNKKQSLIELKEEIEDELYTLSKAHYEKYFVEPLQRNKSIK